MEMGESLKKMLGVSEDTPAPSTFANTPTGVQDTERSSWQSPALLRMTGAVAEKVGDAVQDVALKAGAGVATSAAVATGAELVADPLNFIPGAKPAIAAAGLVQGQKIFRGTKFYDEAVLSRRLLDPAEEGGMHVSIAENTAREFAATDSLITMESKVGKPYWVEDTGGTWNPHQMVETILNRVGDTLNDNLARGHLSRETKQELIKISDKYREAKKAWGEADGVLDPVMTTLKSPTQSEYIAALDTKYNKQIQGLLRKEGYDHLSYINTREGKPVESAIIFDRSDVNVVSHSNYKHALDKSREEFAKVYDLDPSSRAAHFAHLGDLQRGRPESAMLDISKTIQSLPSEKVPKGANAYQFVSEHVGDLNWRLTEMFKWGDDPKNIQLTEVANKIRKVLPYIEPEIAKIAKSPEIGAAAKAYSIEHKALPVYNDVQYDARRAAILWGRGNVGMTKALLTDMLHQIETNPEQFRKKAYQFDKHYKDLERAP